MLKDRPVRIFVSSPADVDHERAIVKDVIEHLARDYLAYFPLRAILWEDEALTADRTFQAGLTQPAECEIVLVILWTRLGSPLPEDPYRGMTGTEWEFVDAVTAFDRQGTPEVLVYKKTAPKLVDITAAETAREALADRRRLEDFFRHHFFNEDNTFRRAFRTFDTDAQFRELLEVQLRKLLNRRISAERQAAAGERHWHGSPFRCRRPFEPGDERVFTGREAELRELTERLKARAAAGQALVLLSGPSGCGKTSLLRAGLVPHLQRPFHFEQIAAVRCCLNAPLATDPLGSLAASLCADVCLGGPLRGFGLDAPALAALLAANPQLAAIQLTAALGEGARVQALEGETRLVVIVDPLDVLMTNALQPEPGMLNRFAEALAALALSGDIWVVAALRSDALCHLSRLPALAELLDESAWQRLEPLPSTRIRQIIEIPARIAGLELEAPVSGHGPGLVERIEAEAETLRLWAPPLEALLDSAYQAAYQIACTTEAGGDATVRLGTEHWRASGGLAGQTLAGARALWRDALEAPQRAALPPLCRALLTLEGDGQARARTANLDVLQQNQDTQGLLTAMIEARLLITEAEQDPMRLADCESIRDAFQPTLAGLWRRRHAAPEREPPSDRQPAALDWSALIGVVSLAHPVLPQAWEPLTEWLDNPDNRTLLRLRERLSRQARLWKRTQCNREYLFGEAGFAAVRAFAEGFPDELEPLEADYLRHNGAWLAFVRQRNRRVRAFGLLLILLLLTASTAAWIAQRKSRDARLALHRVQLKEANLQSLGGNTPQAVEKALAAGLDLPGDAVRVLSLAFSRNRLLAMTRLPDQGLAAVDRVAANAAGDRLATLLPGQGARQWQLSDGRFVPAQTPVLSDGTLQLHRLVMALETDTVFGVSEQGVYRLPAFAGAAPAYACGARAGAALALDAARQRLALAVPGAPGHQDLCVLDLTEPGRVLLRQPLAEQELRGLSFAPDGQALLTASALGRTHLLALDGAPGEAGIRLSLPAEGPLGRPFNQAIFDAGGQRIAIAAVDERVRLYRRDGQPLGELRHSNFNGQALQIHNSAVRALAFDPDGHFLVAVDDEGQVVRWTLDASAPNARDAVVLGHHDGLSIVSVEVAAAQPAGALVLTASLDGTARLWSLATGKPLAMFGHDAALSWARFAASATRVLSHSRRDQSLRLWSITPVSRLAFELKHPAPGNHIWHLDLTPLPGGHPARLEMDGETQPLLLASAGYDGQVRVWHYARDGRMPRLLHRFAQQETPDDTDKIRPVRRVQFSPSGRWLAAARFDGTARVHDLLSGRSCRFAAASENSGRVFWAVFDPRERWLLTASDDPHAPVRLFDPRLCQPVAPEAPLWGSSAPTAAVAVVALADATLVALGDETGRVRIMREHPGGDWQVLCERDTGLGAIGDLALDGDGRLLAIASEDSRLGLLELEPEGCGSLTLASGHGGRLYSVDFAPDGRSIVSASLDKTARLWNRAGRPLAILSGHQDRIYSARFSPGAGRWLLTASRDGSLRLWRVPRMDRVPDVPQELDAFLPLQASLGGAAFGAFSPDGRYVAGAYWENAALLWRVWREDGLTDRQIARHWGTDRARLALLREAYRFRDDNQVSEFTESWWDN